MVRKKQKSGAIEFSITTIIVVVLGVVIIGLGIAFVGDIFDNLGRLTTQVNENAQGKIEQLGGGTKFSVPSSVSLKEGDSTVVKVRIGNDGSIEGEKATFRVDLKPVEGNSQTAVTALLTEHQVALGPGDAYTFSIIVDATDDALARLAAGKKTPAFLVTSTVNGNAWESRAFVVKIEQSRSLFG